MAFDRSQRPEAGEHAPYFEKYIRRVKDGDIVATLRQQLADTEALLRAIHTMNGAFAMTDVPEITAVTDPAETFIKRSLAASQLPDAEGVDALAATDVTAPSGQFTFDDHGQAVRTIFVTEVVEGDGGPVQQIIETVEGVDQNWTPSE